MTDYYDVELKKNRNKILQKNNNFYGYTGFIQNQKILDKIYQKHRPNILIHLAAQAGVRYSIENPLSYVDANLLGTFHILEMVRKYKPDHFLMASTSSVYGNNKITPFQENHKTDMPISFYAATKKSNEVMAHSYSNIYKLPCTGVRFFTVYGPFGRPDMSILRFIHWIASGQDVIIYGDGNQRRSFTYISDIVDGVNELIKYRKEGTFNFGSNQTWSLNEVIELIEKNLGKDGTILNKERAYKDVDVVLPSLRLSKEILNWQPTTNIEEGIKKTVEWYIEYEKSIDELNFKYDYE